MAGWAAWLVALVTPVVGRVFTSLGLGIITFAGFAVIKGEIDSVIASQLGSIHASVYQILALAGMVDAIGMWLGALTTVLTFMAFSRIGVVAAA